MKKILLTLTLLTGFCMISNAQTRGFAIVIDPESYRQAGLQVDAYARQVRYSGLEPILVIDHWNHPDSIRQKLIQLYNDSRNPIEGAVFIGDIPIVLTRDAQHMTSAFKMDQVAFDRKESSVPSDRFYDDFNLEFTYIDRDEERPDWFYYSLTENSAQKLRPTIYSGRIRPTDAFGTSRYEKLRQYLEKVVEQKNNKNELDHILYFSGNGFISESLVARIDEKRTLLENFPWLQRQRNGISYIDHRRENPIKFRVMNEMQREDLDFAILHHHGVPEVQYMNAYPEFAYPKEQVQSIKIYLRESLRHARERGRNVDSIRTVLAERFDTPLHWFDGAFDPELMDKDSVYFRDMDLFLEDFADYRPNARIVVLDACYNGSFHQDNSIANAYIFSEGKTVVALGNTVNVIQDKWTDRYFGLIGMGMNVGNIVKYAPYLEQHVIGDPTFTFHPANGYPDINMLLREGNDSTWQYYSTDTKAPALTALSIEKLFHKGLIGSDRLLEIFEQSPYNIVRMQALINLSELRDDNFIKALILGVDDSYEMVERFSMNMLGKSGDDRLIEPLVRSAIRNNTSERIEFSIKQVLPMFETEKLMAEFERQFPSTNYRESDKVRNAIAHAIRYNSGKWIEPMDQIMDSASSEKNRYQNIRAMRNYHVHFKVPELLEYLKSTADESSQAAMLEAFGWFYLSKYADDILKTAEEISNDTKRPESVRKEAAKTVKRLSRVY